MEIAAVFALRSRPADPRNLRVLGLSDRKIRRVGEVGGGASPIVPGVLNVSNICDITLFTAKDGFFIIFRYNNGTSFSLLFPFIFTLVSREHTY